MEADTTHNVSALLACRSRADLKRLRGMDSPSFPFITLACKHNRTDLLQFLLKNDTFSPSDGAVVADPRWCSVEQEYEGHNAVYYTIRSSNVELLRTLLGTLNPELSERLISESYGELLLNNVLVTEEMHIFVQYMLVDLRFFSKDDGALPATSTANIQERIQLLVENVEQINTYDEVDSHFLYTAKFIAQNIQIMKQQLKSTYNILPWEEMEFCLVSFVSAHMRQELNMFYLSVLRKERLLKELNKFASDLQELEELIRSTDVQKLRNPVRKNREDVAATINGSYPDLYADYKEVRDISSLHIMKTYLDAALLVDSATRVGQLTIKRALQVTGEHLKNTLDSPKLSPAVSDLLLLSAPQETRSVLKTLRNSLSHPHLESEDAVLYSNIQIDIKKVASVISDITYFNKVNTIKRMLTALINSNSVEEFQEIANVFRNISFRNINAESLVQETDNSTKDHQKLEDLLKNIEDQTPYEKKLFVEIKNVFHKTKLEYRLSKEDYIELMAIVRDPSDFHGHGTKTIGNLINGVKFNAKRILKDFPTQKNSLEFVNYEPELGSLLCKFYDSVSMRIKPEIAVKILFAIGRINYVQSFGKGNINGIDDYSRQLNNFNKNDKRKRATNSSEKITREKISLKITELENRIGTDRMNCQLYEHLSLFLKDNTTNRLVLEGLVMDTMSLLDSAGLVPNNMLYLDGDTPLLNGKCLRNHLAHRNALVDILPTDAWSAVLLNATKLTESKHLLMNCKIGNILEHNIKQLRQRYERGLSILDKQKEMWKSLLDGNFENFRSGIAKGADICSRKKDLSSTLHYAVRGPNIDIIIFLIKQEMISTELRDVNGQTALHIAASYGRDVTVKFLVAEMGNAIDQVDGTGKTPLHLASGNGHKKTVVTLLSLGAKPTVKDFQGYFPLRYAVEKNYLDVVEILLQKDATVEETTDSGGFTYLHIAAEKGHVEMVQYLLLDGADVDAKTKQGILPLHLAALHGHLEVVNTLLEKGAHVNLRNYKGQPPLQFAVENGHKEIVKILLEKEAYINIGDNIDKNTPFHTAIIIGNAIIVDLLLQHKANFNIKRNYGVTPLLLAVEGGHADIVDLLLQNGALADCGDIEGVLALHSAAYRGHTSITETLIQRGVDINTKGENEQTPLLLAARAGHLQVVNTLLAAGANVHSACYEGSTALHLSARNGHSAISDALIKGGANVNSKNNINSTPLHAAASKTCNQKTIQILLKHGADVISENKEHNRTALHIASFVGDGPMVEALLQGKADVDAKDNDGATALHMAAWGNHKAAVEVLLKYEADVNCLDATGSSALCWPARNNNTDLLNMLLAKGANFNIGEGKLLFTAITAGHRLVVEALLERKDFDVNIKDQNGLNLLCAAAKSGDGLIARMLIERGIKIADGTQPDFSPLFIAITLGHTEFVNVLLENGADINPIDPNSSPLHQAVLMNKPDILERLLHYGANYNMRDSQNMTPLAQAVSFAQMQNTSILLQQECVRINERSNNSQTLLHIAAQAGNLDVIRLLVDRGADINAETIQGFKPIHIAARHGHRNILAFFLELGMSIDDRESDGSTLMHYAAEEGQLAVAQYLIDKHVDINSIDLEGFMPIHCSAEKGHIEVVKLLLKSGAVYDARDKFGKTPSDLTSSPDVKELLESIGKLFKALKQNDVKMVCTLVKDLVNYLDVKRSDNSTLLHIASWKGFQQVCDILLQSKANPNIVGKGGNAPLHYAAKYSHPGIVESLLKNGAVHNPKSDNKKTPLDFATQKDVNSLLRRVALCFKKVRSRDIKVVQDINTISNVQIIKAVMKARDTNGNTLVVVAMKYDFPAIDMLKQVSQANACDILSEMEMLFLHERFAEGLDILKQLLNERVELLGEDNPGTLDIQYNIAHGLYKQSKFLEAMPMLEDIYRKTVETFGPDHPDSLRTRSMLALLLFRLGRVEESWDIFQEVMPRQQEVLGEGHAELMVTKNRAGLVLASLGKYKEALHLHRQLHKRYKNTEGAQSPNTLTQQNNIALVLLAQGEYHEALNLFQTVFEARKKVLGQNHSDTLRARRNMALVLTEQHKFEDALQVCQQVLAIQKNVFGLNHIDTIRTLDLMTGLYYSQHHFYDTVKVHKAGLDARNAIFGPNNPMYTELDACIDMSEKLLKSKMEFNDSYILPCDYNLLTAASEGDSGEVRRLIENGSDVFTADDEGKTALHCASTVEVTKLLLDNGADATAISQKGNTPLHLATLRTCGQTVRLLLQNVKRTKPKAYHKFINAQTVMGGSTALHVATKKEAADIVSCLLEHGACYNSRDRSDNRTPLQCSSSPSVTQLLHLAEKVFEMAERGGTVLPQGDERHLAAVLNSRDTENRTPLQLARIHGHTATARLLSGCLIPMN